MASIPKIYSEQRMIRVIGNDNQRTVIDINKRNPDGTIKNEVVESRYEVCGSAGPAFKTARTKQ